MRVCLCPALPRVCVCVGEWDGRGRSQAEKHTYTYSYSFSFTQLVEMVVDLCLGGRWDESPPTPTQSATNSSVTPILPESSMCKAVTKLPMGSRVPRAGRVLQVGGLVHPLPPSAAVTRPPHFRGCLRNLRVNGEVSLVRHYRFLSLTLYDSDVQLFISDFFFQEK